MSDMRTLLNIVNESANDRAIVAGIIERAGFDESDRDSGTSGLCATFALVLYRALAERGIPAQIVFICKQGKAAAGPTDLIWRHAAVKVAGSYFDIDGEVELEHMIQNYCWGGIEPEGGIAVPVTPSQAIEIIRKERTAYDARYRNIWRAKLKAV